MVSRLHVLAGEKLLPLLLKSKIGMGNFINLIFSAIFLFLIGCSYHSNSYQVLQGPVKTGFVDIENGQLFYQIVGKGDPIIVIHGGPGLDQGYLLPGMSALCKNHQVVFYDQLGSGLSTINVIDEKHINIDLFVEDIETLRKTLGFEKITIIGHSWGGMLAMRYAIKYTNHTKKLVLMNTLPATSSGIHDFIEAVERKIEPSFKEIEKIQASQAFIDNDAKAIEDYYRIFFKHYLHNPSDLEKLNTRLNAKGAGTGKEIAKILEPSIFTKFVDLTDNLKKLKIPTLILHAESDALPLSSAKEIADAIKGSKLVIQKECGHFPYIEKPKEWLDIVEDFLCKHS